MTVYSFEGNVTLPDGSEFVENGMNLPISQLLGTLLMGKTEGVDSFKAMGWVVELLKPEKTLNIDDVDRDKIIKIIEDSPYGNLFKYVLLKPLKGL